MDGWGMAGQGRRVVVGDGVPGSWTGAMDCVCPGLYEKGTKVQSSPVQYSTDVMMAKQDKAESH